MCDGVPFMHIGYHCRPSSRQNRLQPQLRNPFHLLTCRFKLLFRVIGQACLKRREDACLCMIAHGDDEGEAVFGGVVGVEALELGAFCFGQGI